MAWAAGELGYLAEVSGMKATKEVPRGPRLWEGRV